MRIRSTKPEFWRSRVVASVDWEARFVLKGLESYVDDNGVGKDDLELIVGDLFPRDMAREPSRTLARVSVAIRSLHQAGLVWRYEVDGHDYLFVSSWESVQRIDRAARGRYPRPDGTMDYGDSEICESLASPREPSRALATGTGEQGNRGTGEQGINYVSSEVADATLRPAADATPRPDVDALLAHLDEQIARNGARTPARTKRNVDAARLLLDRDGHTVPQILAAIDFATSDEFWRSNILSMSKLREQYDRLRLAAQRQNYAPRTTSTTNQRVSDVLALAADLRAKEDAEKVAQIGASA